MANQTVSVDEFLSVRKDFVKSGNVLMKAAKAPSTWNSHDRSARFVMSSEIEDRDRDIVMQAGLDVTEFMKNPVAPFAHRSTDFPIGMWSDVEKILTGRPKRTEGTLNLVPEGTDGVADRLAFHIASGSIRACSIGFVPRSVEQRDVPQDRQSKPYYPGYKILEAELVECSPVAIPSNPAALAKSAAEGDVMAKEIIEQVLDEWMKHPETGLIIPREEFERAHKVATGERTSVVTAEVLPPSTDNRSLIRRALDLITGSEANQAEVDRVAADLRAHEADQEAQRQAKEKAERERTLQALEALHAKATARRELAERHAAFEERLKKVA